MYISYDRKEVWAVASLFVQSHHLLEYRELMTHTSLGFRCVNLRLRPFWKIFSFAVFVFATFISSPVNSVAGNF